jgi:Uncharacterized protein conserved in bacteria (DUF2252)
MAVKKVAHPSVDDRKAEGFQARDRTPLSSHAKWRPPAGRPDPVALLEEQDAVRTPGLVPVRHGRMMVSPFTFYRGGAAIMAANLAATPVAGLEAQLCGDAHLASGTVVSMWDADTDPGDRRMKAFGTGRDRHEDLPSAQRCLGRGRGPGRRVCDGG